MIPKNVREGATAQNLPGETRQFTISANGKAFRTLIDGLYSNKIRAVIRELCSNAQDSHVEAKQVKPFKVSIPTHLDPTFRVRDFGTSLAHEDVMGLYTTIFQSTREGTNDATGMLGLGSKSPFAYTDSFSVTTYLNGEQRLYLAFLATDGVPSLTHVSTTPTDEPTGLEVSFAAHRTDINEFQREMQFVSMGYSTPPEVEGMKVQTATPRLKGNGWAIYPRGSWGDLVSSNNNHFIRQGSALYPTETAFPHVGYGWFTITEIPIGTAEVAASREALSYDQDTRQAVKHVHNDAYNELKAQIDAVLAAAKTRIEIAKVHAEYNGILDNLRGSTLVSLRLNGKDHWSDNERIPGDTLEAARHFGKAANARRTSGRYTSSIEYTDLAKFQLLVNDPEVKTVRRAKRIREVGNYNYCTYVLNVPALPDNRNSSGFSTKDRKAAIAWIVKHFELRADQITYVSALPDCPPDPSTTRRAPSAKRVLKPGQFWMSRQGGRVVSGLYGISERGTYTWPREMHQAAKIAGMLCDWDATFWVTEKQEESFKKKGLLPETSKLDVAIQNRLIKLAASAPLDEAQTVNAVYSMVGEYNKALPVVFAEFFPEIKITRIKANEVLSLAVKANIKLETRPIVATINARIKELISQYPLLFQKSDRSHYEHYIQAVKSTTTRGN